MTVWYSYELMTPIGAYTVRTESDPAAMELVISSGKWIRAEKSGDPFKVNGNHVISYRLIKKEEVDLRVKLKDDR